MHDSVTHIKGENYEVYYTKDNEFWPKRDYKSSIINILNAFRQNHPGRLYNNDMTIRYTFVLQCYFFFFSSV